MVCVCRMRGNQAMAAMVVTIRDYGGDVTSHLNDEYVGETFEKLLKRAMVL